MITACHNYALLDSWDQTDNQHTSTMYTPMASLSTKLIIRRDGLMSISQPLDVSASESILNTENIQVVDVVDHGGR